MNSKTDNGAYWSVDIPGLSQEGAEELLRLAGETGISAGGSVVDPTCFLTLHMDEETVDSLLKVFAISKSNPSQADALDLGIASSVIEVMREWRSAKDSMTA